MSDTEDEDLETKAEPPSAWEKWLTGTLRGRATLGVAIIALALFLVHVTKMGEAPLIDAYAGFAWPIFAGLLIWWFRDAIKTMLFSRDLNVEVAGFKVSVGSSIDKLNKDIAAVKTKLVELEAAQPAKLSKTAGTSALRRLSQEVGAQRCVLWVDDKPEANAHSIAQLNSMHIRVETATSTESALEKLDQAAPNYDLVLSDIGRTENGVYQRKAGLDFLERLRNEGHDLPVIFFTSPRTANLGPIKDTVTADKNASVTGSTAELFRLINAAFSKSKSAST